mmetsp:Transcript_130849/g.279952  ORF Transcript_130849/g.279952 Transcript_130849/m.279952 type:complete len:555 (+) Transcript_130849:79-1743(+)
MPTLLQTLQSPMKLRTPHLFSKGCALDGMTDRLEVRVGRIQLSGRYHHHPRKIEDDYALKSEVLGTGANGEVRMASSKSGSKEVFAVKSLKLSKIAHDKFAQLQDEVENFLCMDHPHIVRLFDVYQSKTHLYLVMEAMAGGELFERVTKLKRFEEKDAADAMWQMLLAVNYLHRHEIVHRDIKLENFLYDDVEGCSESMHLKLIDFGFSKMCHLAENMSAKCGTLAYVSPDVLRGSYTSQCDLWSLGVIGFIILSGYMPFSGAEEKMSRAICGGNYTWKPERWGGVSEEATHFVKSLLEVNPATRLTAGQALEHPWIQRVHEKGAVVDRGVAEALREFGHAGKFRRCCMEMVAWSLSNEERAQVREAFIDMDTNKQGTISLGDFKRVMRDTLKVPDEEIEQAFAVLDSNHDEEIAYSDFLAAMVSSRIGLHEQLIDAAFKKFDVDSSGYITPKNLRMVLGETFEGEQVERLISEADLLKDNRLSYPVFAAFLRGTPVEAEKRSEMMPDVGVRGQRSISKTLSGVMGRFRAVVGKELHGKEPQSKHLKLSTQASL